MAGGKARQILTALSAACVDYVLVGGFAAVINGASVDTLDIDIVHSRDPDNVARLLAVLADFDAIFRVQPERKIRPNISHLQGPGYLNLLTTSGPFDVLGTIGRGLSYPDLLPHTRNLDLGDGFKMRVLNLETLIALKEELGGARDLLQLPILRRALEEQRKTR